MQVSPEDSKRTINGTFRVSQAVYDAIRKEARENRTSVNTVLNQILWTHFFSDWPLLKPKQVAMSTLTFSEILSRVPDEGVKEIGRLVAQRAWSSHFLPRYGTVTVDILAEELRSFAEHAGYGAYSEVQDRERMIALKHELGSKGSVFIAAYVETLVRSAGIRAEFYTTENEVVVKI